MKPFLILLFAASLLAIGCNRSSRPKTVPVQGKVTWQGKPLPNGMVGFEPVQAAEGVNRPASGTVGPDGVYHVSSYRPNDGLVPGEYLVTVQSYVGDAKKDVLMESTTTAPMPVSRIPERYTNPAKSGLKFTVPTDARGPLTYDIDLK